MDPARFMQRPLNSFKLGGYLGLGGEETEEERAISHRQGIRLFELFGVVPRRDGLAYCPDCGNPLRTMTDAARYGWRYFCLNHQTRRKISPLVNTFLCQARLNGEMTADKVVMIIYMWLNKRLLVDTQTSLFLSTETAVFWYGFCRDVASAIAWHEYIPIGGAEDVVEVDETHLFRRKYDRGRMPRDIWVLGGISRTSKRVFARVVPRRDADTLLPILQECIDGDSYICSDFWLAYGDCHLMFNGHGRVNHSENFITPPRAEPPLWMPAGRFNGACLDGNWNGEPPIPGQQPFRIHTQHIERAWRDLKTHMRYSANVEFVSQYIGEWMYRRNILKGYETKRDKFERFLRDISRVYPGVGKRPMQARYEDLMDCDCHECHPNR